MLRNHREVFEASLWTLGIILMAVADPTQESLFEVCLLKMLGFSWCPGCGLGHAVGFLARGEWSLALSSHPLSPMVVAVLAARSVALFRYALGKRSRGPSSHALTT